MTIVELRKACRSFDLDPEGTKVELLRRLKSQPKKRVVVPKKKVVPTKTTKKNASNEEDEDDEESSPKKTVPKRKVTIPKKVVVPRKKSVVNEDEPKRRKVLAKRASNEDEDEDDDGEEVLTLKEKKSTTLKKTVPKKKVLVVKKKQESEDDSEETEEDEELVVNVKKTIPKKVVQKKIVEDSDSEDEGPKRKSVSKSKSKTTKVIVDKEIESDEDENEMEEPKTSEEEEKVDTSAKYCLDYATLSKMFDTVAKGKVKKDAFFKTIKDAKLKPTLSLETRESKYGKVITDKEDYVYCIDTGSDPMVFGRLKDGNIPQPLTKEDIKNLDGKFKRKLYPGTHPMEEELFLDILKNNTVNYRGPSGEQKQKQEEKKVSKAKFDTSIIEDLAGTMKKLELDKKVKEEEEGLTSSIKQPPNKEEKPVNKKEDKQTIKEEKPSNSVSKAWADYSDEEDEEKKDLDESTKEEDEYEDEEEDGEEEEQEEKKPELQPKKVATSKTVPELVDDNNEDDMEEEDIADQYDKELENLVNEKLPTKEEYESYIKAKRNIRNQSKEDISRYTGMTLALVDKIIEKETKLKEQYEEKKEKETSTSLNGPLKAKRERIKMEMIDD
jgi:hypothetical protein